MEKEQVLELFLKLVARAKKSVPLYPPESPLVRQWVQRLHLGIPQFLADGLSFPVRFETDRVLSGETALQTTDPLLDALRFDLLTRGIKEVSIHGAVEEQEVAAFLNLLNMDPFIIRDEGGVRAVLDKQGVRRIDVREIAIAPGADRGKEQEWRTLTLEEWVQLLVDQALRAVATHLRALALNRSGLSQWLEVVGEGDRVDLIYIGVRTVCGLVASERESSILFRTIAEAVFTLPEPLQLKLMRDWLFPRVAEDVGSLNLISHFSEDEFQRLVQQLPGETFLGLATALAELPWEDVQKQRLLESLTAAIRSRSGGFRRSPLAAMDEKTVARARETVVASFQSDRLLEIEVRVLLALLFHGETDEYPTTAVDALQENLGEALTQGRLDLAVEILTRMRSGALRDEWIGEHAGQCKALFQRAADQTHVSLLSGLPTPNRRADHEELTAQYLRLVGEEGIRQFIALLAEEGNRRVRAFMCRVLVKVGPAAVPSLWPFTKDRRWYVARNAVTILAQIGDAFALSSIIDAARHPDPRVRREVAQVLGVWGEGVALTPLVGMLQDPDPTVQMTAVKVLGGLATEEAACAIKDLALSNNSKSIEFSTREEAVRTLATMGTQAAQQAIREIAHRRLWIWQRQERQLRSLAARAATGEGLR